MNDYRIYLLGRVYNGNLITKASRVNATPEFKDMDQAVKYISEHRAELEDLARRAVEITYRKFFPEKDFDNSKLKSADSFYMPGMIYSSLSNKDFVGFNIDVDIETNGMLRYRSEFLLPGMKANE